MKVETVKSEKEFLELKFEGDSHTLLNLIKKQLIEDKSVSFAGYNKPHPLIDESFLTVRAKDPKKVVKDSIDNIIKELKTLSIK